MPLSAEHYNLSETETSLFKQSETARDVVISDTASSVAGVPGYRGALAAADDFTTDTSGEHHQQVLYPSQGMSSSCDFDDNEPLWAESIILQESTASAATSSGASLGTTSFLGIVNRIASALFPGDMMKSINFTAVEDPGLGPKRYHRNRRRLIETLGKFLMAEANTLTEHRIAAAIQTRRILFHVADVIMKGVEGPRPSDRRTTQFSERMNEEQHINTSTKPANKDEVLLNQELEDEVNMRKFILDSDAYMQFKGYLLDSVHRLYDKRILTALDSSLNRTAFPNRDCLAQAAREIS